MEQARRSRSWALASFASCRVHALALLVSMAAFAVVTPAAATVVKSVDLATQAATADRIFVGTVTAVTSRPNAAAPSYFETIVSVTVEESVAGSGSSTVDLRLSGGEIGGIKQRIEGMPEFAVGERYVIFVESERQPPLTSPIVGFNQGLYRVVGETRAGAVVRDRAGRRLAGGGAPGDAAAASITSDEEPTLDAFLARVRAARQPSPGTAVTPAVDAASSCPDVPSDASAFIGATTCPPDPGVRWADATVAFDCQFFTDADKMIDCGGDTATCVELCRTAASVWNADLPGRFTFIEATPTTPVTFCDTEDGLTSIGGKSTLCDGTAFGPRILALTLSIFFSTGPKAGQLIDANVVVNQAFSFTPDYFRATLTHELGHVLGLAHPDACGKDFNVLMRSSEEFPPGMACFVVEPTTADVNGARDIYGLVGPVPSPSATPGICGDADMNGSVTVSDGVQTLRAAAGLPSACVPARCDVDGNGTVSVTDGVDVLRVAAGLPFTARCPP